MDQDTNSDKDSGKGNTKNKVYATLLKPNTTIGGDSYRVEGLIGKGGMGEVWAARQLRLGNRKVAVKVLRTHGGDAPSTEALTRFKNEAEIASRLQHPHIVNILDYNFTPEGHPFMVMEFLEGESLGARLKRTGPLSLAETRLILRQVCCALEETHRQGIIHRDLKPDNIFLTTKGGELWAKILDFGISKITHSDLTQLTQNDILLGSPRYVSPEQAHGQNDKITFHSDIFSLGSVVYEMLTGKPAFEGEEVSIVLHRITREASKPLSTALPELPLQARLAIEKAHEKQVENRHASAMAFCEAFEREEPPAPPKRSRRRGVWVGAALALALAGGAALVYPCTHTPQVIELPPPGPGSTPGTETTPGTGTTAAPGSTGTETTPGTGTTAAPGTKGTETTPGTGTTAAPGTKGTEATPGTETTSGPETSKGTGSKGEKTGETDRKPPAPRLPSEAERRILAKAEEALKARQPKETEDHIRRALNELRAGSPGWARAQAMRAEVACMQKDLSKYNTAMAALPEAWKPSVRARCKSLGFDP